MATQTEDPPPLLDVHGGQWYISIFGGGFLLLLWVLYVAFDNKARQGEFPLQNAVKASQWSSVQAYLSFETAAMWLSVAFGVLIQFFFILHERVHPGIDASTKNPVVYHDTSVWLVPVMVGAGYSYYKSMIDYRDAPLPETKSHGSPGVKGHFEIILNKFLVQFPGLMLFGIIVIYDICLKGYITTKHRYLWLMISFLVASLWKVIAEMMAQRGLHKPQNWSLAKEISYSSTESVFMRFTGFDLAVIGIHVAIYTVLVWAAYDPLVNSNMKHPHFVHLFNFGILGYALTMNIWTYYAQKMIAISGMAVAYNVLTAIAGLVATVIVSVGLDKNTSNLYVAATVPLFIWLFSLTLGVVTSTIYTVPRLQYPCTRFPVTNKLTNKYYNCDAAPTEIA